MTGVHIKMGKFGHRDTIQKQVPHEDWVLSNTMKYSQKLGERPGTDLLWPLQGECGLLTL